jgi:hypothetical protein
MNLVEVAINGRRVEGGPGCVPGTIILSHLTLHLYGRRSHAMMYAELLLSYTALGTNG